MKLLPFPATVAFVALLTLAAPHPADATRGDITLRGQVPLGSNLTDVWGHKDAATGRYYALVGSLVIDKVFIVDVTDPVNPFQVAEVSGVRTYDVKALGPYAYTCDGGALTSGQTTSRIIDLTDPTAPVLRPETFRQGHNLTVTTQGYLFLSGNGGIVAYDLNTDPLAQVETVYQLGAAFFGHDATQHGTFLYDFARNQGADVWDLSTFPTPTLTQTIPHGSDFAEGTVCHSGDVTEDGRYLFICDESTSSKDVLVWDLQNPATSVAEIHDPDKMIHNLYIECDLAFTAFYSAGFRVYDVSNPTAPALLDGFETSPSPPYPVAKGAWGVYPFDDRGYVYVSDTDTGLWIFSVEGYDGPGLGEVSSSIARADGSTVPMAGNILLGCPQGDLDAFVIDVDLKDECFSTAVTLAMSPPVNGNVRVLGTHPTQWQAEARPPTFSARFYRPYVAGCGVDESAITWEALEVGRAPIEARSPDIDGSGWVDILDFSTFGNSYSSCSGSPQFDPCTDLNDDGCTDLLDLSLFAVHYGHKLDLVVSSPVVGPELEWIASTAHNTGTERAGNSVALSLGGSQGVRAAIVFLDAPQYELSALSYEGPRHAGGFAAAVPITRDGRPVLCVAVTLPAGAEGTVDLGTVRVPGALTLLEGYALLADESQATIVSRSGVATASHEGDASIRLAPASPTPFRDSTTLSFTVPDETAVTLDVLDVHGKRIRSLRSGNVPAGEHAVRWDARDNQGRAVASGVYWIRLSVKGESVTRKVTLLR